MNLDFYYHRVFNDDSDDKYDESAFPIPNSFTRSLPDSPGLADATRHASPEPSNVENKAAEYDLAKVGGDILDCTEER